MFRYQPAKGAALEGHWETNRPGTGADWALLAWPDARRQGNDWSLALPDGLSLLATGSLEGRVRGLREFPVADQPPALPLLFYAFRLMVLIGCWFLLLSLWTLRRGWRFSPAGGNRVLTRRLLRVWVASVPLGYVAVECGWFVREVGRQPWIVYGLLRTATAASVLPATGVAVTLLVYAVLYAVLAATFVLFARRILRQGPEPVEVPVAAAGAPVPG